MTAKDVLPETHEMPWSWLKTMSRELYQLDQTPLLGYAPSFPWEKFAENFADCLGLSECSVQPGELVWREKEALTQSIASPQFWTEIAASGLEGSAFLIVSKADIQGLLQKVLGITFEAVQSQQEELIEAFYRFAGIETLHLINTLDFDKRLSFRVASYNVPLQEPALCQDVKMQIGKEKLLFRLCLSKEFHKSWNSFYQAPLKTLPPTKERLEQAYTTLSIQAGCTSIGLNELATITPGDFLFLDHPIYIPDSEESHVILSLQDKPLFRATLKGGTLTISQIPQEYEVYTSMVDKVNQPFAPAGYNPNEKPPVNMPIEDEENPFEDEDEDEEELELTQEPAAPPQKPAAVIKAKQTPAKSSSQPLTANDIPLTLIVQVAELQMSAQKLLELQPGNMVDLDLSPEAGVDLVINGRIIGKGELLKIGDSIGVRILQIGT